MSGFDPKRTLGRLFQAVRRTLFNDLRGAFAKLRNCVRCFERKAGQQARAEKQREGVVESEIAEEAITIRRPAEGVDETVGVG